MLFARWCTYLEGMLAVLPVRCMAQTCLQDENLFQALYLVWLMLATCQPFEPFPHVTCDHAVAHATACSTFLLKSLQSLAAPPVTCYLRGALGRCADES